MLGSISEADDAVQETWLRLSRSDTSSVENLGGWLTTVVARVCLDMLRSRNARREGTLGVHVPEAIVSREEDGIDPEHESVFGKVEGRRFRARSRARRRPIYRVLFASGVRRKRGSCPAK
jgi:DNA-directed RNA polymerase specialized sigma24 family protein